MSRYAKSIVALLLALATWGVTAAEDSVYTQVELWGALLAIATAAGVFFVPNKPDSPPPLPMGDRGDADTLLLVLALGVGLSIAGIITDTAVLLYAGLAGVAVGLLFLLLRR